MDKYPLTDGFEDDGDKEFQHEAHLLLVDTVLLAIELGGILDKKDFDAIPELGEDSEKKDPNPLLTFKEVNLVFNPHDVAAASLSLPTEFSDAIDENRLQLMTISFSFRSLGEKPYFELGMEDETTRLVTITRPGIDSDEPYKASFVLNNKDYEVSMEPDSVADIIRQLLPTGYDYRDLHDPQYPPHSRQIIDTLQQSYNHGDERLVDTIMTSNYKIDLSLDDALTEPYTVTLHYLNDSMHEIEITQTIKDEMYFDQASATPVHETKQIRTQFALDDYSHAVKFYYEINDENPEELKPDKEMMQALKETIQQFIDQLGGEPPEVRLPDDL